MNTKQIRIDLIQGEKIISFNAELSENLNISQVAGTLALRIVGLFQKVKKFNFKLDGFSFARKFDVKIIVEGKEASGSAVILNGSMQFGITLQNTDKSVTTFGEFVHELVNDVMTGAGNMEIDLPELLAEVGLSVEEVPAA